MVVIVLLILSKIVGALRDLTQGVFVPSIYSVSKTHGVMNVCKFLNQYIDRSLKQPMRNPV